MELISKEYLFDTIEKVTDPDVATDVLEHIVATAPVECAWFVHCKDCEWWENPIQIQGLKGNISHIGMCELTEWFCGEQGYCMYGRKGEE